MVRRFFNQTEKTLLYIAADGKCENCGEELGAGWHADHIRPYSKNGATALVNGQALCPECNLKKGNTSMTQDLREWQQEALGKFLRSESPNFLAVACPGAGKTTFALTAAKELIDRGEIDQVVVVVPSDALRTQWSSGHLLDLRPFRNGEPVVKRGYDGVVTTYQALTHPNASTFIAHAINHPRHRFLVILDEIHHAADSTTFGKSLQDTFENAHRRLLLTGTPWRTNPAEVMPWVRDHIDRHDVIVPDYEYGYGEAVKDGVCRPIQFPFVEGLARWSRKDEAREEEIHVSMELNETDESDAVKSLLDAGPTGEWMKAVLTRADQDLDSYRTEVPDAGGLIVARDRAHAKVIADRMVEITGQRPPVVVSSEDEGGDNEDAQETIKRFRKSSDKWIIAVKMIAEGVDIPRLMVGVYATNVVTNLFFTQVVGRFIRVRRGEQVTARMYVVPTPRMWSLVRDIERVMPQEITDGTIQVGKVKERSGGDAPESSYISLGSDAGQLAMVAAGGETIEGDAVTAWETALQKAGVPSHYAPNIVATGAEAPLSTHVAVVEEPRHERETRLRKEIHSLAKRIGHRHMWGGDAAREVLGYGYTRWGAGVKDLTVEQLEAYEEVLQRWLATGEWPIK